MTRSLRGRSRLYKPVTRVPLPARGAANAPAPTSTWTFMGGTNGTEPAGAVVAFTSSFNWTPSTRRVLGDYIYFGYYGCSAFYRWNVATNFLDTLTPLAPSGGNDATIAIHGSELVMVTIGFPTSDGTTVPYDIGSDTWGSPRTPLPEIGFSRYAPSLCQDDDFVYVISGESSGGPDVDSGNDKLSSFKYELATDTWTQLADLDVGFWSAGCDVGTDGKVYVIGGFRDSLYPTSFAGVVRVYDPGSDTWDTSRADPPVAAGMIPGVSALNFPVVAALPDGKLLYGGGQPYNGGPPPFDNGEFWIYDPDADTFTPTTASDTADPTLLDLGHGITATDGNTVYSMDSAWDVYGRFDR